MIQGTGTPRLEDAILALAARDADRAHERNDVGFNGSDTSWGNRLAGVIRSRGRLSWREGEYAEARRRLMKYRAQLAGYGVAFDAIPATDPSAAAGHATAEPAGMIARVAGRCARCGGEIPAGGRFLWGAGQGQRIHGGVGGAGCPQGAAPAPQARPQVEAPATSAPTPAAAVPPVAGLDTYTVDAILGPGGWIAAMLPGYEARESQLAAAWAMEAAIVAKRSVVVEAGTGTGKSLAYLAAALGQGKRVIVSTADKGLQEQLDRKDVPFMRSVWESQGRTLTAVTLKGVSNYVCVRALSETRERVAGDLFGTEALFTSAASAALWPEFSRWADETESGDVDALPYALPGDIRELATVASDGCVGSKCPLVSRCFSQRARERAKSADVVIVNHALLMRDAAVRAATDGAVSLLPDVDVLIVDEAHHVEDVATDALGTELSLSGWERFARRLERMTVGHKDVMAAESRIAAAEREATAETESLTAARAHVDRAHKWADMATAIGARVEALLSAFEARLRDTRAERSVLGDESALTGPVADALLELAREMAELTPAWLVSEDDRTLWQKLGRTAESLATTILSLGTPDPDMVRYVELERERVKAFAKPIEVADMLKALVWDHYEAVIATSATIAAGDAGMGYWLDRVGLDADELVVWSPFDYQRNALLYVPADGRSFDSTLFRLEGTVEYFDRLAAEYERLILASRGGTFALFSSRRALNEVYSRIAPRLQGLVLRQGELPRPELVKRFRADGNAVLFGVKSFWEGVDVQGDALSLVIIDKLPFTPPDDPVFSARCARIDRREGRPGASFGLLSVPIAIIALKQGFGRLIRTRTDRGVVALLDGRLRTKSYGARILAALPPATRTGEIGAVQAFYGISR